MLSEDDMKEIEKARSNILRGNDIESAALILEKVIWDNLIIVSGRVDITKVAVRQILNFIEEYKDKGYLDVIREKVKANEEITKLQKENKDLNNTVSLCQGMLRKQERKIIKLQKEVEHQKEKRENQKGELAILFKK